MTAARTIEPPVTSLPWAATVASLIAFSALFISEKGSILLPILAIAILVTYAVPFRLEANSGVNWLFRIIVWGTIITLSLLRPADQSSGFNDARQAGWLGELFAAELTLQTWRRVPEGGHRGVVSILLSGLVFGVACDVWQDRYIPFLTPIYAFFLTLSLWQFRPVTMKTASTFRNHVPRVLILAVALGFGFVNYLLFHSFRSELTNWGMQFLHEKVVLDTAGMSWNPHLSSTFNLRGSDQRVLRIVGSADLSHLRGMAFDTYRGAKWGPIRADRQITLVSPHDIPFHGEGTLLVATRLVANEGILFLPLNASSADLLDNADIRWSKENSSPLLTSTAAPNDYTFTVGPEDNQGPLCAAPTGAQLKRLLTIPPDIDPRVVQLARQIGGSRPTPAERVRAVEAYLLANNSYSLTTDPGQGDPISNFLLEKKAAHCEYFASAAVILARCLGVPARYVVGYSGHEGDSTGATIVRQRDAHAWAECWIDGKGWITLDATPGDGRPEGNTSPISPWVRFREWSQDFMSAARRWFSGTNGLRLLLVVLAVALVLVLWQWRRQSRPPAIRKAIPFSYTAAQAELAEMFRRFEAFCLARSLACPPDKTWQEYLSHLPADASPLPFRREDALGFLRAYNAARFGATTPEAILHLQEMLSRLLEGG